MALTSLAAHHRLSTHDPFTSCAGNVVRNGARFCPLGGLRHLSSRFAGAKLVIIPQLDPRFGLGNSKVRIPRLPAIVARSLNEKKPAGDGGDFELRGVEAEDGAASCSGRDEGGANLWRGLGDAGRRWSSWVVELVAASSFAAAVWVTSAALVVALLVSEPLEATAAAVLAPRKLRGDELATVQLFQENTPSVVYITNLAVRYARNFSISGFLNFQCSLSPDLTSNITA